MAYDFKCFQAVGPDAEQEYEAFAAGETVQPDSAAELILWRRGSSPASELAYSATEAAQVAAEPAVQGSTKPRRGDEKLREARAKLVRLKQAVRAVTARIKYLDPKLQSIAQHGQIGIDFNTMMKQLEQLNSEVHQNPNRFEFIMIQRYPIVMKTIGTLHHRLNELEQQTSRSVG